MKVTNDEFKRMCELASKALEEIRDCEQCKYQSLLDNRLNDAINILDDYYMRR